METQITGRLRKLEQEYRDAFERLKSGRGIRDSALRRRAQNGQLRINISTVAREAGHSRTLIGMDGCRFKALRDEILAFRSQRLNRSEGRRSAETLNVALREEKKRSAFLASENLALLRKCKSLELRLAQRDRVVRDFQLRINR